MGSWTHGDLILTTVQSFPPYPGCTCIHYCSHIDLYCVGYTYVHKPSQMQQLCIGMYVQVKVNHFVAFSRRTHCSVPTIHILDCLASVANCSGVHASYRPLLLFGTAVLILMEDLYSILSFSNDNMLKQCLDEVWIVKVNAKQCTLISPIWLQSKILLLWSQISIIISWFLCTSTQTFILSKGNPTFLLMTYQKLWSAQSLWSCRKFKPQYKFLIL